MSAMPNETIDTEIVDDELKAPVLQDIKYPVKASDLEILMSEYKDIPNIDLDANDEKIGEQYQFVLAGHKKFVKARNQIEKVRKTLKAPALEYGKKVDAIAKEFQAKIKPIEDKLAIERRKVEENEARKQREAEEAEERRIEAIQSKLSSMERLPLEMMQKTSLELREFLGSFDVPTEKEFEEFYGKALILHSQVQSQLSKMADEKELVEKAQELQAQKEAEAARLEAERQARLEAERQAFEREKAEFEAQKARLKAEQDAMRKEQERKEAERLANELQAKQEAEKREREQIEFLERKKNEKQKKEKLQQAKKETFEVLDYQLNSQNIDIETLIDLIQDEQIPNVKWVD